MRSVPIRRHSSEKLRTMQMGTNAPQVVKLFKGTPRAKKLLQALVWQGSGMEREGYVLIRLLCTDQLLAGAI